MADAKFMMEQFLAFEGGLEEFNTVSGGYHRGHITSVSETTITFVADTFASDHMKQAKRNGKKKARPMRYRNDEQGVQEELCISLESIDFTSLAYYTPILDQWVNVGWDDKINDWATVDFRFVLPFFPFD